MHHFAPFSSTSSTDRLLGDAVAIFIALAVLVGIIGGIVLFVFMLTYLMMQGDTAAVLFGR